MWLEHLLFGARFDTGFSVKYEVQVSLGSMKFSLFSHIRRPQPQSGKFFEIFLPRSRKASEERGIYLMVMTERRFAARRRDWEKEEEKFIDNIEKR